MRETVPLRQAEAQLICALISTYNTSVLSNRKKSFLFNDRDHIWNYHRVASSFVELEQFPAGPEVCWLDVFCASMKTISPAAPVACPVSALSGYYRNWELTEEVLISMRYWGTMLVVNNLLRCMQVGALPQWNATDILWGKQAAATGHTHTQRALWTLWVLIRVNQLNSASQTFTTNVLVDLTWQLPMRLPWPASKSWCMLILELLLRTGNGSPAKIIACQKWVTYRSTASAMLRGKEFNRDMLSTAGASFEGSRHGFFKVQEEG